VGYNGQKDKLRLNGNGLFFCLSTKMRRQKLEYLKGDLVGDIYLSNQGFSRNLWDKPGGQR